MAKKTKDITESGPGALKGIRNPDLYSNGANAIDAAYSPEQLQLFQDEANRAIHRNYNTAHGHIGYEGLSDASLYTPQQIQSSEQGLGSYSKSSYDQGLLYNPTDEDVQNKRAYEQPWYLQIGAGITKGAVLAGTTFLDGIGGTIAGLMNVGVNAAQGNIDGWGDGFNKFIDNPFSNFMQQINDGVEQILPNYYSTEEQNTPWYTNIFTANFIGDKFLKNLGFTIGAAYSAKTVATGAAKALKLNKIREAYKGAVMTATGEALEDSNAIAKAYLTGDAVMDGTKIASDLAKAAKKMKRADMTIKTVGAVSAASGEGRIEAIQGSKEWAKLHEQQLKDNRDREYQLAEQQLLQEHPEYFSLDVNGNPQLTAYEGQVELANRRKAIDDKFEQGMAKVNEDKAKMANIIFSLNLPLLSVGNAYQFGKFIAGGYNSGRLAKNLVTGSFKEGFKANKAPAKVALAKAIGVPLWEAQEEMSQQWIQEIPGAKYGSELNSFYGKKIDPDAEKDTIDWLKATSIGFMKSYGDSKQWEQGFIGGLTGLLGAPRIHLRNKEGKFRPSITNEGELYNGIREYRELNELADKTAARLNSKDFINYYRGKIRHEALQNDLDEYLEKGDNFNFKTTETGQLLSDIMMMDNAGRLQEFLDNIEDAGNITVEDVADIRNAAAKEDGTSFMDKMSDDEVVNHIKKQADKMRKVAESYSKISNDLKTLYGDNIDQDFLEELTWHMTQIDNMESRGQDMLKNIREQFENKAKELKDRFGIDIDVVLNKYGDLETAFSKDKNLLADMQTIIQDKNLSIQEQRDRLTQRIKESQEKLDNSNLSLGRDIRHIKKRNKEKLARLQGLITKFKEDKTEENLQSIIDAEEQDLAQLIEDYKTYYGDDWQSNPYVMEDYKEHTTRIDELHYALSEEGYDMKAEADNDIFSKANALLQQEAAFSRSPLGTKQRVYKGLDAKGNPIYEEKAANGKSQFEMSAESKARARNYGERDSLMSQIVALQEMLNDSDNKLVNPLLTQKLADDFTDLLKIVAMRTKFINDYNSLSKNPEMFTESAIKQAKEIVRHYQEEIVNKKVEDIQDVETLKELKGQLAYLEGDELDMLVSKVEKGDNKELKALVKEYKELVEARSIMEAIRNNEPDTPEAVTATNIIYDALDNADSYKDALSIIDKALKDSIIPKAARDKINDFLEKYEEILKSKKATEKDTRTPEKKSKGSKKKKDSEKEEEIDDTTEEEEEKEEETPKPKKKKRFSLEDLPEEEGVDAMQREEAENGNEESTGLEDKIISEEEDIEEYLNSLDFDNNYYLIHQTHADRFGSILQNGFKLHAPSLEGTTYTALSRDKIEEVIKNIKEGHGHGNATGLIVFKFPKNHPAFEGRTNLRSEADISESVIMYDMEQKGGQMGKDINNYIDGMLDFSDQIDTADTTEPFEDTVTSDNLSDYIKTLTNKQLDTIGNTLFTSTTALEKTMGINLDESMPRDKNTLKTIQDAAKAELEARNEAKRKAKEEAKKKAEEEKKRKETKLKPKKKVKITDSSTEEHKSPASPIDMVQDLSDEELQRIVDGEVELDGVSAKEQKAFERLAKAELESRTLPAVGESGEETNSSLEDEDRYSPSGSMRSWRVAQYEFKSLSNRKRRKAVIWDSPMVKALQKLGAFEFVDNGSLGTLFNDNPEIPIHFILSDKKEFKDTPLLAIKVTKEVTDLVKPINPITIKDSEGKEHQYQIVGTLYHNNTSASKTNFKKVVRSLSDELLDDDGKLNASYKVSEQSHTQIRHMYSGRFVKSDAHSDVEFRSLRDIMKGEKPYFYIYYNPTQSFTTVPKTEAIVPLNTNNQNPREGSVWLATKEADGRFYLKALKVARFDSYDLEAHKDAPIVERIMKDIQDICNSELSDYERSLAKYDLEKVLHFPENHRILFHEDSVSISNYEDNIGGDLDPEEKAEMLLDALQDKELSLRFNLNPSEMNEESYIQEILDSDILTTDILYPHNVNASFDVYLVDNEGNPIVSEEVEATGHTGRLGINTELSYTTVIHNGAEYSIDEDGNIYDSEGELLDDQDAIDEIKFNQQIRDGEVNPEEGTNLYIGHHKDGSPFGVVNYRTVSEERMNEILEKAKKKSKKKKAEETLDDIDERPSKKNKARSAIERLLASDEDEDELEDIDEDVESESDDDEYEVRSIFGQDEDEEDELEDTEEDVESSEDDEYEVRSLFGGSRTTSERSEDDIEDEEGVEERSIFGEEDEYTDDDSDDEYEERSIFSEDEETVEKKPTKKPNRFLEDVTPMNGVEGNPALRYATESARTDKEAVIDDHTLGKKKGETVESPAFDTMAKKGRKVLQGLGFKSVSELKNFIAEHQDSFPELDTITTQEEFDTIMDNIRDKCYK